MHHSEGTQHPEIMYLVVVHGMGEQKPNESILPVIELVADILSPSTETKRRTITRGMLNKVGQNGGSGSATSVSVSLSEIQSMGMFPESKFTHDIHFAEFCWTEVLEKSFNAVGQPVDDWIECVIGRYENTKASSIEEKHLRGSNLAVLHSLELALNIANKALTFRSKELADIAFGKYLGDVQVYNEHPTCRVEAITKFHQFMQGLHNEHCAKYPSQRAQFIIVAHSLGSVLSMEALVCSQAEACGLSPESSQIPVYRSSSDAAWTSQVSHFITLGSPIDKMLTLWKHNYSYIHNGHSDLLSRDGGRIELCNYSDEQDPAGQKLDIFESTEAFKRIFTVGVDELYSRSFLPGIAHVTYWSDRSLWGDILCHLKLKQPIKESPFKQKLQGLKKAYRYLGVLSIGYLVVPIVISALNMFLFKEAWTSTRLVTTFFYTTLFAFSGLVGAQLISLFVWWREGLQTQDAHLPSVKERAARRLSNIYMFLYQFIFCAAFALFTLVLVPDISVDTEFWYRMIGCLGVSLIIAAVFLFRKSGRLNVNNLSSIVVALSSVAISILIVKAGIDNVGVQKHPNPIIYWWLFCLFACCGLIMSILQTMIAKVKWTVKSISLRLSLRQAAKTVKARMSVG